MRIIAQTLISRFPPALGLAALATVLALSPAHAFVLNCANPDGTSLIISQTKQPVNVTADSVGGQVILTTDNGQTHLRVSGHPLRARISRVNDDGSLGVCQSSGNLQDLFTPLITDPMVVTGMANWAQWKALRPAAEAACSSSLDSTGYFQPGATKIALVFHGVGESPTNMKEATRALLDDGYNVIAPRLSRHFTMNLKALDNADYREWIADSESSFKVARTFVDGISGQVTIVGFSLGGLLGGRLGLRYADNIDRLALFAPAWRINATASAGTLIGSLIGVSLNDFTNTPVACAANYGYVPASAGTQISYLISSVASSYGVDTRTVIPLEYNRLVVPYMVVTSDADIAIDAASIGQQCDGRSQLCTHVQLHDVQHTGLMDHLLSPATFDSRTTSLGRAFRIFLDKKIQ